MGAPITNRINIEKPSESVINREEGVKIYAEGSFMGRTMKKLGLAKEIEVGSDGAKKSLVA